MLCGYPLSLDTLFLMTRRLIPEGTTPSSSVSCEFCLGDHPVALCPPMHYTQGFAAGFAYALQQQQQQQQQQPAQKSKATLLLPPPLLLPPLPPLLPPPPMPLPPKNPYYISYKGRGRRAIKAQEKEQKKENEKEKEKEKERESARRR
ncbi:hypothetical protein AFGD_006837 [Aspergillus flavus]|nr:hypothetical protein AFGD_006837 [Aspergillus flavus]